MAVKKAATTKIDSDNPQETNSPKKVASTGGNTVKPNMGKDESGDHNDAERKKSNAGKNMGGANTADRNKELSKDGRAGTGSRSGSKSGSSNSKQKGN